MWHKLIGLFGKHKKEQALVSEDCAAANLKRIHYVSLIGAAISLIHLSLFLFSPEEREPALAIWRTGIIFSHSTILVVMIAAFAATQYTKRTEKNGAAFYILQYGVIAVIMAAGVVIVSIDQLATSNITPFILVCLITGTVFLIEPIRSLQIFLATYIAYYFAVAVAPQSAEQMLSNRVNGVASVGIGFALSMIMWRLNVTNILQKKHITAQQQQLEKANRELEQLAYFDALTGLPNRRHFDEILDKELALIELKGHESCLVMLDVDNFKNINDVHGHPAGRQSVGPVRPFSFPAHSQVRYSVPPWRRRVHHIAAANHAGRSDRIC